MTLSRQNNSTFGDNQMNRAKRWQTRNTAALLSLVASLIVATGLQAAGKNLDLYIGQAKIIYIGNIDRVAVGNGGLLSTSITDSGQLIVLPEAAGDTNLHIWKSTGQEEDIQVRIRETNSSRETAEVRDLLKNVPNVTVRELGGHTVLEGELHPDDLSIIEAVSSAYSGLLNLTQPPKVDVNQMIYMSVKITEFNTRKLKDIGIDWTNSINGPSLGYAHENNLGSRRGEASVLTNSNSAGGVIVDSAANALTSVGYFGISTEITSIINFAINNNDALILAEPRLAAHSGGEAEFLSGGEIPLPSTNTTGQSNVEFKKFGISLLIKPFADDRGNITGNIETEISTVDDGLAVNGIPGFRSRKTVTDISMRDGETLVLSGLISQELSKITSSLAWLGDLPVLGSMFRSDNLGNNKSELVIFVTPTVVEANSQINQSEIIRGQKLIDTFWENAGDDAILD